MLRNLVVAQRDKKHSFTFTAQIARCTAGSFRRKFLFAKPRPGGCHEHEHEHEHEMLRSEPIERDRSHRKAWVNPVLLAARCSSVLSPQPLRCQPASIREQKSGVRTLEPEQPNTLSPSVGEQEGQPNSQLLEKIRR